MAPSLQTLHPYCKHSPTAAGVRADGIHAAPQRCAGGLIVQLHCLPVAGHAQMAGVFCCATCLVLPATCCSPGRFTATPTFAPLSTVTSCLAPPQFLGVCACPPAIVTGEPCEWLTHWIFVAPPRNRWLGLQRPAVAAVVGKKQFYGMMDNGMPPTLSACPAEYCSRGSLTHVLQEGLKSPQKAALLTWQRRLRMVSAAPQPRSDFLSRRTRVQPAEICLLPGWQWLPLAWARFPAGPLSMHPHPPLPSANSQAMDAAKGMLYL